MRQFKLIPDGRHDAVLTALREAFGSATASGFSALSGGVSGALILSFKVRGGSYVLRIEPERIALQDRRRGFTCMEAAAKLGAAPPVHFADPTTGIAIMDFVPGRPLPDHPGGPLGAARALGALLARVRQTPAFPMRGDYPRMIGAMLAGLTQSGQFSPGKLDPHAQALARIQAALPWDASSMVSSHNDPNPRNILFDGERVWLVDWELAFLNDPLVDVAILTTEMAETPELEHALVEATFGAAPDRSLLARLNVIRLLTRLFYGCIVLDSLGAAPPSSGETDGPTLTPLEFRAAVADGRLASGAPRTARAFAKMSLAAFVAGCAAPEFEEMLKTAS